MHQGLVALVHVPSLNWQKAWVPPCTGRAHLARSHYIHPQAFTTARPLAGPHVSSSGGDRLPSLQRVPPLASGCMLGLLFHHSLGITKGHTQSHDRGWWPFEHKVARSSWGLIPRGAFEPLSSRESASHLWSQRVKSQTTPSCQDRSPVTMAHWQSPTTPPRAHPIDCCVFPHLSSRYCLYVGGAPPPSNGAAVLYRTRLYTRWILVWAVCLSRGWWRLSAGASLVVT